jgi:hypothetical protein
MAFQVGATGITLMERALETTTSTSATSSSSDTPFFPDPSSLVPPTSTSNSGHKQTLSKVRIRRAYQTRTGVVDKKAIFKIAVNIGMGIFCHRPCAYHYIPNLQVCIYGPVR